MIGFIAIVAIFVTALMVTAIIIGERSRSRMILNHAKRLEAIVHQALESWLDGDDIDARRLRNEVLRAYEASTGRAYDGGF